MYRLRDSGNQSVTVYMVLAYQHINWTMCSVVRSDTCNKNCSLLIKQSFTSPLDCRHGDSVLRLNLKRSDTLHTDLGQQPEF